MYPAVTAAQRPASRRILRLAAVSQAAVLGEPTAAAHPAAAATERAATRKRAAAAAAAQPVAARAASPQQASELRSESPRTQPWKRLAQSGTRNCPPAKARAACGGQPHRARLATTATRPAGAACRGHRHTRKTTCHQPCCNAQHKVVRKSRGGKTRALRCRTEKSLVLPTSPPC